MNDRSVRTSQDTVHHHEGRRAEQRGQVPNTSPGHCIPWLASLTDHSREGKATAAARLAGCAHTGRVGVCFLYPDTINTFLWPEKHSCPCFGHKSLTAAVLDAAGSRSRYSHFTWAVNPAGTTAGAGQQPAQIRNFPFIEKGGVLYFFLVQGKWNSLSFQWRKADAEKFSDLP